MPPTSRHDIPAGGEDIAIQFSSGGGLSGPCCAAPEVPGVTVYGDGSVVFTEGTVGTLPGMRQATLDRGDVVALVDQAREAGLLGQPDTGTFCCDFGYTRVVIGYGGTTHELSVVGLGHEDVANARLTDAQLRNRHNVAELRDRLSDLVGKSGDQRGYAPAELAVYVRPAGSDATGEPTPWPLDTSLAEGGTPTTGDGRCLHVTDGSRAVVAAARKAETNDWSSAGQVWWVVVRPLLPHEHGCP